MKKTILILLSLICGYGLKAQSVASNAIYETARSLYEKGEYRQAIESLRCVQTIDKEESPNDFELHNINEHWIASCYCKLGLIDSAMIVSPLMYSAPVYDRKLTADIRKNNLKFGADPSIDDYIQMYNNNLKEEVRIFGENGYPLCISYLTLGHLALQNGDYGNSQLYITKANHAYALSGVANQIYESYINSFEASFAAKNGDWEKAISLATKAMDILWGKMRLADLPYEMALIVTINYYIQKQDLESANVFAEKVRDEFLNLKDDEISNFYRILSDLMDYYTGSQQTSLATELCDRALINATPNSFAHAQLLLSRGKFHQGMGNHKQAVEDIEQSIIEMKKISYTAGDHYYPYLLLGDSYANLRDFISAENAFKNAIKEALQIKPANVRNEVVAKYRMANLYKTQQNYEMAKKFYTECRQLDEQYDVFNTFDKANLYLALGQCEIEDEEIAEQYFFRSAKLYESENSILNYNYISAIVARCKILVSKDFDAYAIEILDTLEKEYEGESLMQKRCLVTLLSNKSNIP